MLALPLVVLSVLATVQLHLGKPATLPVGPIKVPCAPHGKVSHVTDIYAIHSYWSPDRSHLAPRICAWFKEHGGNLSDIPCTPFPGFWATNASREQILDLVARRIVAPETHARPQSLLTWFLYRTHLSKPEPLFDHQERVINPSYLGTAASHLLAVQNWTLEMSRLEVPFTDRSERHMLLLQDDARLSPEGIAALQRLLPRLPPCYDVLSLDASNGFCGPSHAVDAVWRLLRLPGRWRPSPRPVRARVCYSRTTGLLMSYKGALKLLRSMPVTRTVDLWYRDLVSDGVLQAYAACPRVLAQEAPPGRA